MVWKLVQSLLLTRMWYAPASDLKFISAQKHKAWIVGELVKCKSEARTI